MQIWLLIGLKATEEYKEAHRYFLKQIDGRKIQF